MRLARRIALAALLAACTKVPEAPRFAGVDPIPESKGRVYVYRQSGTAMPGYIDFVLDGRPLATLGYDEYVSVLLSPGSHMVVGDPSVNLSGLATGEAQTFRVRAGEPVFCGYSAEMTSLYSSSWRIDCSDDAEAHEAPLRMPARAVRGGLALAALRGTLRLRPRDAANMGEA